MTTEIKGEGGWITLEEWCFIHNERRNTVHKRVADGTWERGELYSAPDGGQGFVHRERAEAWLAERGLLVL